MPDEGQGAADDFSRSIARAIADAQAEAGLTTRELLKRSGLSTNYFYRRARGELPYTTNDISALAAAIGVTVADIWTRAQAVASRAERVPAEVRSSRVRKMRNVARAQFPTLDIDQAVVGSEAALAAGLDAGVWEQLLSGTAVEVSSAQLRAVCHFFGVDPAYLLDMDTNGVTEDIDARLEVQEAFAQTGARGASSRSVAGATPASLRALARAIREGHEPRE